MIIGVSEDIIYKFVKNTKKYTFEKIQEGKKYETILISLDTKLCKKAWKKMGCPQILSPTTNISYIPEELRTHTINIHPNQLGHITATAEHAFCLFLMACRKVRNDILDHRNQWLGRQLSNMKVAIFGHGRIGKLIEGYCKPFGIETRTYDKNNSDLEKKQLLTWADGVFVCMTYDDQTEGFFNLDSYEDIKQGQIFVNISRAQIIDKSLIIKCLDEDKWDCLCMDFINHEDLPYFIDIDYKKYYNQRKMILTPHIAGNTSDSLRMAINVVLKNLEATNEKNISTLSQ